MAGLIMRQKVSQVVENDSNDRRFTYKTCMAGLIMSVQNVENVSKERTI